MFKLISRRSAQILTSPSKRSLLRMGSVLSLILLLLRTATSLTCSESPQKRKPKKALQSSSCNMASLTQQTAGSWTMQTLLQLSNSLTLATMFGLEIKEEPSIVQDTRLSLRRIRPTGSSASLKWVLMMPQLRLTSSNKRLVPTKCLILATLKAQLKCSGVSQTKIRNGKRESMFSSLWPQLLDWLIPSLSFLNGFPHSLTSSEKLSMLSTSTRSSVLIRA